MSVGLWNHLKHLREKCYKIYKNFFRYYLRIICHCLPLWSHLGILEILVQRESVARCLGYLHSLGKSCYMPMMNSWQLLLGNTFICNKLLGSAKVCNCLRRSVHSPLLALMLASFHQLSFLFPPFRSSHQTEDLGLEIG